MLEYLHLTNVGPAPEMELELAPRLNLLTGDNGLGKSFLLDVAWWALARQWPHDVNPRLTSGYRAQPRSGKKSATISYRVRSKQTVISHTSEYRREEQAWVGKRGRPHSPGLVIYAHADGGFSVWDPARNYWKTRARSEDAETLVPAFVFTQRDVWRGLKMKVGRSRTEVCQGLLKDWATWIREDGRLAKTMAKTLQRLAAPGETLAVGPLRPRSPNDPISYPTIATAYDEAVPVLHTSAGLRRIIALAYILLWSWDRHIEFADAQELDHANRVIFLFDEIEAHLHPRWQRSILRSVLDIASVLHKEAEVQLMAATHSPLVLASAEPLFDPSRDAWFDLDLNRTSGVVELRRRPFVAHGDASNWLASEAFDLGEARSIEAEIALEAARTVLRQPRPTRKAANAATKALVDAGIPDIDPFWVRWTTFVERLGGRV
jgi:predicted ATPase